MTVAELIERLKTFKPDAEILFYNSDFEQGGSEDEIDWFAEYDDRVVMGHGDAKHMLGV